jgi:hypothetical protein
LNPADREGPIGKGAAAVDGVNANGNIRAGLRVDLPESPFRRIARAADKNPIVNRKLPVGVQHKHFVAGLQGKACSTGAATQIR